MKKKVLYMINSLKNGGPVNMLHTLVKYVDTDKFDVTILALKPSPSNNTRDFSELNCKVIVLEEVSLTKTRKAVQKLVNKFVPDIIHSHGGVADVVNSKLKGKHITFSTIHCDPYEDFCMKKGKIFGMIKATTFISTMKKINNPIACSETVSYKIRRRTGISIEFIRNGIDLEKFEQLGKCISRRELGISEQSTVLLFCGYLSKRKNVSFIFDALEKVDRNDIEFVILGNGDQYEELKSRAKKDSRIHMVGRVMNSFEYMYVGDYFISASLSEGLPLAVMEGMACGMPAILSDIESHHEVKKCCPDTVQIFSLDSKADLCNVLNSIKIEPRIGMKAKQVIHESLNAKRMSEEYMQKYINSLKI